MSLGMAWTAMALAAPSIFPTGVTNYDPSAAYNCDLLFTAGDGGGNTYLIDMNGHLLHQWDRSGFPAKMLDPALTGGKKGEIGVQTEVVPATGKARAIGLDPKSPALFRDLSFGYLDWSGKVLWQWGKQAPGGAVLQHHDWALLANGDTLLLGAQAKKLKGFGDRKMLDQVIYEVDRAGKIVWSWSATDHLEEFGFSPEELALVKKSRSRDYLHLNDMQVLGPNHWEKAGDSRFAADNILISSRNANFIAIISRKTGKIVWRLGPYVGTKMKNFKAWTRESKPYPVDGFSGQHDAHMIPEGLPGAGDILIFDNEGEAGYPIAALPLINGSRVLEINPVKDEVVWQYSGTKTTFFSPFISSVQRLPNGNTLIDEGIDGRFFQVTPEGRIVWEYVSPYARGENGNRGNIVATGMVYRVQAVPYDWVPLKGPHSQVPVHSPAIDDFHIAPSTK